MPPIIHTPEPQIARLTALRHLLPIDSGFAIWLANGAAILAIFLLSARFTFLDAYPAEYTLPVASWISGATDWFLDNFKQTTRMISSILAKPVALLRTLLQWLPWPAVVAAVSAISYAAAGWRLASFAFCSMMYMAVTGYWQQSMYTLTIVIVAVPISLIFGFLVGVLAFRSQSFRNIVNPTLDVMQTMPAFSYLVPILVLFGLGPVVGIVATAIYAIPPIVRNTILGLARVSEEIVESGRMAGSSRFQLLWWIRIPVSVPTLLVGVNQTIMAGLSMVVITAILGGFPDIGLEVISSMKKAQFGESILAGFVIALMAMLLDQISGGFVARQVNPRIRRQNTELRRRVLPGFGLTFLVILAAYLLWPSVGVYPTTLVFFPAEQLNSAIGWFTRTFYDSTQAVKDAVFFFLLAPLKEGLKESVRPHVWGFTLNEFTTSIYVVVVFGGTVTATVLGNWRHGVGVAALGLLYFFGTLGIPWLAFILLVVVPAWQIGGGNVALLALVGLLFIAITGLWDRAMVSIQLCGAGVLVSFVIGSTLGIVAALNDQFSKFTRPINDTLQTMPIFVFLIPGVMVFLVGEFTALVSIVLYATVPSIRYTEHGIRSVPSNVVEAARMCGASRFQVLRDVQLPMALPEMMLGLNQTIMMGLAMVVVATLVGAKGLGQEIMVALTWADAGRGLVAGLAIAFIAMITDRVFQAWSSRKKGELGLA